jgi:hypothetical protein
MIRTIILLAVAVGLETVVSAAHAQRMGTMGPRSGGPGMMAPGRASTGGSYFNPKEFTIKKPVPWQKQQSSTSRPGVGILKSTDGGQTWTQKSGPKSITRCTAPGSTRPVRC